METGPRRAIAIVSAIVVLVCGAIVAFYLTSGFSSNDAQYAGEEQGSASIASQPTAPQYSRSQLLQNLEAESGVGASASSSLDARTQMQQGSQSQQPSPTPSSDERKKLIESFDE